MGANPLEIDPTTQAMLAYMVAQNPTLGPQLDALGIPPPAALTQPMPTAPPTGGGFGLSDSPYAPHNLLKSGAQSLFGGGKPTPPPIPPAPTPTFYGPEPNPSLPLALDTAGAVGTGAGAPASPFGDFGSFAQMPIETPATIGEQIPSIWDGASTTVTPAAPSAPAAGAQPNALAMLAGLGKGPAPIQPIMPSGAGPKPPDMEAIKLGGGQSGAIASLMAALLGSGRPDTLRVPALGDLMPRR